MIARLRAGKLARTVCIRCVPVMRMMCARVVCRCGMRALCVRALFACRMRVLRVCDWCGISVRACHVQVWYALARLLARMHARICALARMYPMRAAPCMVLVNHVGRAYGTTVARVVGSRDGCA